MTHQSWLLPQILLPHNSVLQWSCHHQHRLPCQCSRNYIDTYHDKEEAIKEVSILNRSNACINANTKYVLDKYRYIYGDDESDEVIAYNITAEDTINEHLAKLKELKDSL